MENYVGKICPYCKSEIKDGESVIVCPSCSSPHHGSCWDENKGCTTFGCLEQNYQGQGTSTTGVCDSCDTPLGDEQMFCPKCGKSKIQSALNSCSKCGSALQENQEFCSKCGQKAGMPISADAHSSVNTFNATIVETSKKKKKLILTSCIAAVVVVVLGFFIVNTIQTNNTQKAIDTYMSDVEAFAILSIDAGANLEDIADTIQQYWHENIYDDMHGSSIDSAILQAMIDKSDEIGIAESDFADMEDAYNKIRSLPDGVEDDDLEEIRDAAVELYNTYTDFYSLATNPTGNYNSFSEDNNDTTDDFLSNYRALDNLLY